jgi:hypothetical protein
MGCGRIGWGCGRVGGLPIDRFLSLRGVSGALLGRAAITEHQQQVTAAIQRSGRHRTHDGERLTGVMNHFFDRRHRITCREALTEAGTHQQIAFLDISGVGDVT